MNAANQKRIAKMLKALGNPHRLLIFEEIRRAGRRAYAQGHACFLNTIAERLEIGAPTISHHLKELVNAGLVVTERDGKFVLCRIDEANVALLTTYFSEPT